eukprot:5280607-Pleurochrysis_carterae.AAC.1
MAPARLDLLLLEVKEGQVAVEESAREQMRQPHRHRAKDTSHQRLFRLLHLLSLARAAALCARLAFGLTRRAAP